MGTRYQTLMPMVPDTTGIHIEPTNICTLKCSGCARTLFIDRWPRQWKNHNLDIKATLKFLDVDLHNRHILLCGNYGDPIYHPEFLELVESLKKRGGIIKIVTNGSYRKPEWWQALVECLSETDSVVFSIDGLPENFTKYRQNADWSSILDGINACVASSVKTRWKYIPFSFNQEHIQQTRELSRQLGFDDFYVDCSKRFDDSATQQIKPADNLVDSQYQNRVEWKKKSAGTVDPRCQNNQEHFISADGYYSPCCYIADHRFYYKTIFGKNKSRYEISGTSLSQMLEFPEVVDFYKNLNNHAVCQFSCPG